MRYAYVVSIRTNHEDVPVLGVHSRAESGRRQFGTEVLRRERFGAKTEWTMNQSTAIPFGSLYTLLQKAVCKYPDNKVETIRLEKWRVET